MLLLTKEEIQKVVTMKDIIEANNAAYKFVVEEKCVVPLRTNIQAPKREGCFLFMPAYVADMDVASLKIVNIFPQNTALNIPTVPAQVMLINGNTGVVESIMDGTYVTQLRTGAASGCAFAALARKDSKIGAMIGTGGQAACQLEAMLSVTNLDEVRICGRDFEKTKAFVVAMTEEMKSYNVGLKAVETSDEAIDNADVIIVVTSATAPVFDDCKVKAGCTISGIGSYQHHMQEIDPKTLARASKIFFDSTEAVLSESGCITKPLKDGIISESDFTGELGEVLNHTKVGRENDEEIIVFKSVGVAVQDLMAAHMIYAKAKEAHIGLEWN